MSLLTVGGRSTQLVHTFLIPKTSPFLDQLPWQLKLSIGEHANEVVSLQYCGMRVSGQPPHKALIKMQDTMADVHDSLIGKRQVLPSTTNKSQSLGISCTFAVLDGRPLCGS